MTKNVANYISTTNACKLCRPLGASLAFKGIRGAVPFLHGSQGCATYMRRYIISHFNEPIDIASSALGEKNAIYGGGANLKVGLTNVCKKYQPELIGIATTCLTETIGDDVRMLLHEYRHETGDPENLPLLVNVATPSYGGTHMDGFHAAVREVTGALAEGGTTGATVNLLPGLVSAADLRHLREIMDDFGLPPIMLPDYSDTLDGPALREYEKVPAGGTPIEEIRGMGRSRATIEFGRTLAKTATAAGVLMEKFSVPSIRLGLPVGLRESDRFFATLSDLAGIEVPERYRKERGRLIDAYVDAHKYLYGKKVVVYGEEDLVVGITAFLAEIGLQPVICASGGRSGLLKKAVAEVVKDLLPEQPRVFEDVDFHDIGILGKELQPDLLVGNSKGYSLARELDIPLIRVGFPIHDRIGGQRILHLGYRGAQQLFDTITNTVIARKQDRSPVGYSYM